MSGINYEALRTGAANAELPDDGQHIAKLTRAALVDTQGGPRLVTEWADAQSPAEWTSWNRFDSTGLSYTIELLDGLGVDRSALTDDTDLQGELDRITDRHYDVRTVSQAGSRGDGRMFTATYVNGRAQGVQETLSDAPADTADLPSWSRAAAAVKDFGDVPF